MGSSSANKFCPTPSLQNMEVRRKFWWLDVHIFIYLFVCFVACFSLLTVSRSRCRDAGDERLDPELFREKGGGLRPREKRSAQRPQEPRLYPYTSHTAGTKSCAAVRQHHLVKHGRDATEPKGATCCWRALLAAHRLITAPSRPLCLPLTGQCEICTLWADELSQPKPQHSVPLSRHAAMFVALLFFIFWAAGRIFTVAYV